MSSIKHHKVEKESRAEREKDVGDSQYHFGQFYKLSNDIVKIFDVDICYSDVSPSLKYFTFANYDVVSLFF